MDKASIIIVTYNSIEYIKLCLESILKQDFPYEIIVVDNCSSDGTTKFVERNFPFVNVVENKQNLGYGAGNNLGVKRAEGEYVVILNPDTIVEDGWLRELIKPLDNSGKLITAPRILLYDGSEINTCGNINHFTGLTFTRGLGESPSIYSKQKYVSGFSGCCFGMRKKDYLELYGFDEKFFSYNEDSDLSWRAHLKGFEILFVPTSIVRHDYTLKVPPEKVYHLERGRYLILRKYLSWKDFAVLSPSLIVVEILTFGYTIKHGWKELKFKLKAIRDGLRVRVHKTEGDKEKLFKSLCVEIPEEQLTSNKVEKTFKLIANRIFEWNFRMIRRKLR